MMQNNTVKLKREDAVLVVVDVQEKLLPAMYKPERMEDKTSRLIRGCRVLGIDIIATQQYTKGMGMTVPEVQDALSKELFDGAVASREFSFVEKDSFSCVGCDEFVKALEATGKKSVILCGIEAHICVQQTCIDLLERGYSVFLAEDCVSSREKSNIKSGKERMRHTGAVVTNYESLLFEMLGRSTAPEFKMISKTVK